MTIPVQALLAPPTPVDGFFLWGARQAGKTGFAGSLYALTRMDGSAPRWTAHPRDAIDSHTGEQLEQAYLALISRANPGTNLRIPQPLRFIARRKVRKQETDSIPLEFLDPAGEYVESAPSRESADGREIHSLAARSRGLIWLVAPTRPGAARTFSQVEILPQLVSLLEASGGAQISIPVAICLSKIDTMSPRERDVALRDPEQSIKDSLGPVVVRWFEAVCPVHEYFAISSAGFVDGDVQPVNVSEVLDWVVARAKEADRRGTSTMSLAARALERGRRVVRPLAMTVLGAGLLWGVSRWPGRSVQITPSAQTVQQGRPAAPPVVATKPDSAVDSASGRLAVASRDSLLAVAAFGEMFRRRGSVREHLEELAREHASAAIKAGPAGASALVPLRYIRARTCDAHIDAFPACARATVIEDYTWVRAQGTVAQRAQAKRALSHLLDRPAAQ